MMLEKILIAAKYATPPLIIAFIMMVMAGGIGRRKL